MSVQSNKLKVILRNCRKTKTAIPAFNYSDMWDLIAIARAAEQQQTDLIVASNPLVVKMLGAGLCQAMVSSLNDQVSVNLFNHLDHSASIRMCIEAIDAKYPAVMIDGSKENLEENIRITSEVVEYAHRNGVIVEAEIGRIKGKGIEGDFEGGVFLAEVEEAEELVRKTGVDMLAVGIGTAHGFYTETPKIDFDRLQEIAAKINIPLVLHGGTGIPDADIQKAIRNGISKVNVGTIIHATYMNSLRQELIREKADPYTLDVMNMVLPCIEEVIVDRIKVITK